MSDQQPQPDTRDLAFIAPASQIAEFKLRPFSAGTLTLCRALNLSMITGGEPVDDADKQKQLVTLLFIQAAPLEIVKSAVRLARHNRQAFEDEYLLPFEMGLPISELPKILATLEGVFAQVNAADFDVKATGGHSDPNC